MSFFNFRRLFGNSNESSEKEGDDDKQTNVDETTTDTADEIDPLATGELKPDMQLNAEDDHTIQEGDKPASGGGAFDNTLPMPDPELLDDPTQPDRDGIAEGGEETVQFSSPPGVTRPLPSEPEIAEPRGHLMFGQASDQGMIRLNNQDSIFSFFFTSVSAEETPDFGIFVVADGMGGHQEGERASAITARIVALEVMKKIYMPMLEGRDINDADAPTIVESLVDAVQDANAAVREEVADGGTTLTAAVVRADSAHIAHVGDSRAYWINDRMQIEKITRDHSVVERLKELGTIDDKEAETHDQRNVLYRAIGQNEDVEVEIHRKRMLPNSYLLLCSDGLWNMVTHDEVVEIVRNTPDPQEACDKLISLANTHGGSDNISVILVKTPTSSIS